MNIETERLQIRQFLPADYSDTFAIYADEETNRYLTHEAWNELNGRAAFAQKIELKSLTPENSINLAVIYQDSVVGDIYLKFTTMRDTIEIGYVFSKHYRRQGLASEALQAVMRHLFQQHSIHRIWANLDVRNLASQRLCERLGMRQEGHLIQDYWSKGEWTDSYIYAILASEFLE